MYGAVAYGAIEYGGNGIAGVSNVVPTQNLTLSIPTISVSGQALIQSLVQSASFSIINPTIIVVFNMIIVVSPVSGIFTIISPLTAGGLWRKVPRPTGTWTPQPRT